MGDGRTHLQKGLLLQGVHDERGDGCKERRPANALAHVYFQLTLPPTS